MSNELMAAQTEIVVYQPDDMTRLEVKLSDDSVWLTQEQMIDLFQRDRSVISRHIRNAFQEGEVDEANCLHYLQTNQKGRPEAIYNLDVVISVGYRVKSLRGQAPMARRQGVAEVTVSGQQQGMGKVC